MRITRRHLQISLAVLWLLDGLLQFQPFMFSGGFSKQILAPASAGQPTWISSPLHHVVTLVSAHPALANSSFAMIQLALGLALLTRRYSRVALAASIGWALSVWFLGEGLGAIAAGGTLLTGAPGAALLYALIAVIAWPSGNAQIDDRPSILALPVWCALWLGGAVLQLVSGNNSSMSITMMARMAESSTPGWIASTDRGLAQLHLPMSTAAILVALFVLIAAWSLVPGWTRQLSLTIGVVIALTGWLLFQGLGDLTSGQATDPNTGPLIVLLAVAVMGATRPREYSDPRRDAVVSQNAMKEPEGRTLELTN